jgi:S1-C subfamily serine protease
MLLLTLFVSLALPPAWAAPRSPAVTATAAASASASAVAVLPGGEGGADARWEETVQRVVPAVVSIRLARPRSFDTQPAASAVATGFVVDRRRGLILTNRHVAGPGPMVAEAVFQHNEEVPLTLVYRDPVHDFSILHFDPKAVKYLEKVGELRLFPEGAKVGTEIRVLGNDAGEKVSILQGTIARLDRDAPDYGRGNFNDFNTFYIQAASSTSGGSSGSPVVDRDGRVVALNAGGARKSASSYYLPLDRVVRALELVQAGREVPRGTLQATFTFTPYDEARRLGLPEGVEARLRAAFPDGIGLLTVEDLLPGGPADGILRPGDLVLQVQGALINHHLPLEEAIDSRVGGSLRMRVVRGGQELDLDLQPGDLHKITPDRYLEVGGAVLHALSYQQARGYAIPVKGVYVASGGYMFTNAGVSGSALITEVDGQSISTLDDMERALARHPDGDSLSLRVVDIAEPRQSRVVVATMDWRWFPAQRCHFEAGAWPCTPIQPPSAGPLLTPVTTQFVRPEGRAARALAPSLAMVSLQLPFRPDGAYATSFRGTGVVVDAERGWLLVDRDTAPIGLGDLRITFAGSVEVPGRVRWLHPTHNLAILEYDPRLLGDTPVRAVELSQGEPQPGDPIWMVGLTGDHGVVSRETRVARVDPLFLPLPYPPFFRDTNLEIIEPEDITRSAGGVLTDKRGRVQALWASFPDLSGERPSSTLRGLPSTLIDEALRALAEGRADRWPVLGVELGVTDIANARERGLSRARAEAVEAHDPAHRRLLTVWRRTAGSPAAQVLREGDILLSAEGQPVTRFEALDALAWRGPIHLVVLRDGVEVPVTLEPSRVAALEVPRFILWGGALLQDVPAAARSQRGVPGDGVYVSYSWYGGPASRYRLQPTSRIREVDGVPTPNIDAFLAAVQGRADGSSLRLLTEDLDGKVRVQSLKLDLTFWPTTTYANGPAGWTRTSQ